MADELSAQVWDPLIIGAGAAGLAAATLCSVDRPRKTLLVEAHESPGGSAGYFARGFPRRVHDAGATQLIECAPGGLQHELLRLALRLPSSEVLNHVQVIEAIEHVWPQKGFRLRLDSSGRARPMFPCSSEESAQLNFGDWTALEAFLEECRQDAALIWRLFYRFPDFPLTSLSGAWELLQQAPLLGIQGAFRVARRLGASVADVAKARGVLPGTAQWQVLSGLLLDTSQNSPQATPYLVGAMGLSILRRGIVRLPGGMKDLFQPWLRGVRQSGVHAQLGLSVVGLRSLASGGFEVDLRKSGEPEAPVTTVRAQTLVCAVPMSKVLEWVPAGDLLRQSPEWVRWERLVRNEYEWQALALHGVLQGDSSSEHRDRPWYLQIFAEPGDPLAHALYVSIAPEARDPRTGHSYRSFTATLHVDSDPQAEWRRLLGQGAALGEAAPKYEIQRRLADRVEKGTGLTVTFSECATPETYARYTGRPGGRVGGFAVHFGNFLFRAPPRRIVLGEGSSICLAGDSVFPGQGVVAASMSGVLAWSALTGRNPREFLTELVNE